MSFQAGVFYFDGRPVPVRESEAIAGGVAHEDYGAPRSHWFPGVLLSHAASRADLRPPGTVQPYFAESGSITFDGRLDNREDLLLCMRDSLPGQTGGGQTSDPVLALTVYEKWGVEGLSRLVGDWSLAIWDRTRETLVLASDFAGIRPLYYCVQANRAYWSTRLKPLVDLVEPGEIDDEYIAAMLGCGGRPHATPYRGIHSVPPGHAVLVTRGGTRVERFWELPVDNAIRYRNESEYEEQLRALFREAVRCRLGTNAPVVSELSGGLDSSSIVCMASHLIRSGEVQVPRLATVSFDHEGSLDKRYWTAVEEACGIQGIHESTAGHPFLTEAHTGGSLPAFWEQLQTFTASIVKRTGASTYLTGQLGDLVMGNWGDDSGQVAGLLRDGQISSALKESLAWSKALRIPIASVLWRALKLNLPESLRPVDAGPVVDSQHKPSTEDSIAARFRERVGVREGVGLRERTEPSEAGGFFSQSWRHARPERRKHFRGLTELLELRRLQPPEPLEHLDYTHPFVHRPLVTFMLSIPADIACRPGEPRALMRRAFRELWPAELRKRRSKDPYDGVFLESLRPLARTLLKTSKLQVVERGYVDPENLKSRLERLSHSLECNEPQLRQIILLEFWLRAREHRLGQRVPSTTESLSA